MMIFHSIFTFLFVSFILIRVIYHRKAKSSRVRVEFRESRINMAVRAFWGLGYIGLLIVYIFFPSIMEWAAFPLAEWLHWIGMIVTLTSVALIWWVHKALGVQFDTTLHIRDGHKLIYHGPYRWVRHPMYTVLFGMSVGWLLLTANWFIGGCLMAGILLIIITRVKNEEAMLMQTFGEPYFAYKQRTGRFLPRIHNHRGE